MAKTGRFSKYEQQYISDNAKHKTYAQIAAELDRDPNTIRTYIETKLDLKTNLATGSVPAISRDKTSVREKKFWTNLTNQFSDDELNMFEYYWDQMNEQFDHDILPTEELQIIDMIRFEILAARFLKQTHQVNKDISTLEYMMQQEKRNPVEEQDLDLIRNFEQQITVLRVSQSQSTKEVRELQDKKDRLLGTLKATRADRITRIQNKKDNFFTWLEELIENPERRKEMGLAMEKMRLACIKEEQRLGEYHEYEDGKVDQPLLTDKTVREDNE